MRARLGFAIATSVEPDILLLDEVLATGDAAFREKSKQRVAELVREAKAIVLVTHDMNWVSEYCNRAMLIEQGRIVHEGSPDEVVAHPPGALAQRRAEAKEQGVFAERGGARRSRGGAAAVSARRRSEPRRRASRSPARTRDPSAATRPNTAPAASAPRQSSSGRTSPSTCWAISTSDRRRPVDRHLLGDDACARSPCSMVASRATMAPGEALA